MYGNDRKSFIDYVWNVFSALCLFALALLLFVASTALIDSFVYERRAFADLSTCKAKRQESTRKFLSADVVCIPGYRTTKNDTVTVEGLKR